MTEGGLKNFVWSPKRQNYFIFHHDELLNTFENQLMNLKMNIKEYLDLVNVFD